MLARVTNPTNTSPFHFKGLCDEKTTGNREEGKPLPVENNKERTFRRAGNACEIGAGVALNSTIIFTFHLLQVNPVGLFLAVGSCHFYFTATALGEKSFPVAMIGAAGSLSCMCSLLDPVGEWWEARSSIASANYEVKRLTDSQFQLPDWTIGVIVAFLLLGVRIVISRKFLKR